MILGLIFLGKKQASQSVKLNEIKAKKQLVNKIPEFKKQIIALEGKLKLGETEKINLVLKGILMGNNVNYAVINDTYYREGDTLGNFKISKISLDYVVIENKDTLQRKILYLP